MSVQVAFAGVIVFARCQRLAVRHQESAIRLRADHRAMSDREGGCRDPGGDCQ
jgi:hypothetical protein